MTPVLLAGSANRPLATVIAGELGVPLGGCEIAAFPDGEIHVSVRDSVRNADVYLLQPTSPPVERHLLELLLLADACRRAGAGRVTAVVPYFGYARHDRRAGGREPVAARLIADLIQTGGVQRVIAVDLHNPAIEGIFAIPLEHLSAVPVLAATLRSIVPAEAVIIAPDLGAAKLADRYAAHLSLPVAIVHKVRLSDQTVGVRRITGEVRGRVPVVVDDMISTGGTIEAAVDAVRDAGAQPDAVVVATHGLLVGPAVDRLRALGLRRLVLADTVAVPADLPLPVQVASVAPMLGEVIVRLHEGRSLADLLARG
jgi:ribose-phosphate pyrophosphokinase